MTSDITVNVSGTWSAKQRQNNGPGEEPADVSTRIWAWERADPPPVEQPEGSLRWRLTDAGRDAMQGRAS